MQPIIREAIESDLNDLVLLFIEENRFHADLVPAYIQATKDVLRTGELEDFIADERKVLIVAESGGALVGAIIVAIAETEDDRWKKGGQAAYIEDMIVGTQIRRLGVGKALMQAALDWVRGQGVDAVELHVWEKNARARHFYESMGFATLQRRMKIDLEL